LNHAALSSKRGLVKTKTTKLNYRKLLTQHATVVTRPTAFINIGVIMQDKAKLGTRYTCFECDTKFYDLNRPLPICPECTADQTNAKSVDPLSPHGKITSFPEPVVEDEAVDDDDEELEEPEGSEEA
jgi:hypothetical protein